MLEYSSAVIIFSAFFLDLLIGDPRWLPHPVRFIGKAISAAESLLRTIATTPRAEQAAGIVLVAVIVLPSGLLVHWLIHFTSMLSTALGFAVSVVIAATTLAARGLADAARSVLKLLDARDISGARKELALIVGRDTAHLSEEEIARAVVETVAENASDGVVAPLFYLALGGPALAMAYKAINTLDSMVGYRNERYLHFGRAAARLDDIVNYVPARITAVLICLAAGISRRRKQVLSPSPQPSPARGEGNSELRTPHSAFKSSWRIMLRDGRNHPSPNSGYPEAAMAGALGVRLGGPSTYGGRESAKPFIGASFPPPGKKDIAMSVRFMYCAALAAVILASGARHLVS